MWTHRQRLRFREADLAGIMFFGNAPALVHDAWEEFIVAQDIAWNAWFQNKSNIVPIRKFECEYLKPLLPGQITGIGLAVQDIGDSSFTMGFKIWQESDQQIHAQGSLTLVFVDPQTKRKTQIPPDFRKKLERFTV